MQDVDFAADGLSRLDVSPFITWLASERPEDGPFWPNTARLILATSPLPYVLAGRGRAGPAEGGSALVDPDRAELRSRLAPNHWLEIDDGHSLHRDNPMEWLRTMVELTRGSTAQDSAS